MKMNDEDIVITRIFEQLDKDKFRLLPSQNQNRIIKELTISINYLKALRHKINSPEIVTKSYIIELEKLLRELKTVCVHRNLGDF